MSMFDTVKEKTAKLFGIQHVDFASISHAAYDLVQQNGGIPGLQAKFQAAGLSDLFQSWVSDGEKLSITPEQVQKIFGSESLKLVAEKAGISPADFNTKLAEYLPKIVGDLTPAQPNVSL